MRSLAGAPFGQTDFCRYDGEVLGAMAQLVARLVRNEKVGGSNPPSSTTWVGLIARPFCVSPVLLGIEIPGHLSEVTGIPIFESSVEGMRPRALLRPTPGLVPS